VTEKIGCRNAGNSTHEYRKKAGKKIFFMKKECPPGNSGQAYGSLSGKEYD
jgi:hypothetical protein